MRQAGHQGEALDHYCWDRAKFTALFRLVKAWHRSETFQPTVEMPCNFLQMTQFVVTTACCVHDVNKAGEWAQWGSFHDRDLLRDVFVAFESLRNSVNLIYDHMDEWIVKRFAF